MDADRPLVLIVDDDDDSRYVYGRVLVHRGFEVAQAATAARGIELAQSLAPAAIILDYLLPDMTGWEAARLLRANVLTARIPIVNVTAYSYPGIADEALSAGCTMFVGKPCDPFEIVRVISVLTGPPGGGISTPAAMRHATVERSGRTAGEVTAGPTPPR